MPRQHLQQLLLELQQELDQSPELGSAEQEGLRQAEARIRQLLNQGEPEGVRHSVEAALANLENNHPQSAAVLRQVVDTLSAMGI